MYVADLMIWLLHILTRGANCRPYNVGSEQAISIKDLAYLVESFFEYKPSIIIERQSSTAQNIDFYVPSTSRAQQELKLTTYTCLEKA
jgi:dTDP-glucose 4,6-dehydratase